MICSNEDLIIITYIFYDSDVTPCDALHAVNAILSYLALILMIHLNMNISAVLESRLSVTKLRLTVIYGL